MNLRQAAEMALERLCMYQQGHGFVEDAEVITALRAALAEADEPVAWYFERERKVVISFTPDRDPDKTWQPLYTHPPSPEPTALANSGYKELKEAFANLLEDYEAMKTPLTDEEIDAITRDRWGTQLLGVMVQTHREYARAIERAHGIGTDEPPHRKPLTEEQIEAVRKEVATQALFLTTVECKRVVRIVERAHGIGTDE